MDRLLLAYGADPNASGYNRGLSDRCGLSRRIKKLLDLVLDDEIDMDEAKAEMKALDARRKELEVHLKTELVAGARNQRYLQLWSGAA